MPDTPEPVTVGDLRVDRWEEYPRPATVADLVSALRAEGMLVIEKVEGEWVGVETLLTKLSEGMVLWASATKWPIPDWKATRRMIVEALDALAEAQR